MLQYLKETAPRTADGVICHRNMKTEDGKQDQQVWIDGLYMVPPFLAAMHEIDDAWCQVTGFVRYLLDPETHVFFHIWDAGSGTFVRRKRWATGTGWALMGIARVAAFAEADGRKDIAEDADRLFDSVLDGMLRYRTEDDTFHDVLDEPDTFKDHTAGLMTAAAVYRRIAEGKLDDTCLQAADAIVASAEKDSQCMRRAGLCASGDLGGSPGRICNGGCVEAENQQERGVKQGWTAERSQGNSWPACSIIPT